MIYNLITLNCKRELIYTVKKEANAGRYEFMV